MDKEKGLSPGDTAESPQEDSEEIIWVNSPYKYYTPDSPICQGAVPDFTRGVEWKKNEGGKNQIYLWGLPFSTPTKNPYTAKKRYLAAMDSLLRKKIKEQCREDGLNEIMGCAVNLPCWMCREMGRDTKENGCICEE